MSSRQGESVFVRITFVWQTMIPYMTPHSGVYGKYKLKSMGYFKKIQGVGEDVEVGINFTGVRDRNGR